MVRTIIWLYIFGIFCFPSVHVKAQVDSVAVPASTIENLELMVIEVLSNNPEIQAAGYQMGVMEGRAQQMGTFDDPELRYMRDEMPELRWKEPMFNRIEFMQMVRFPTKLFSESNIGVIQAEHAHHEHLEIINKVLMQMKSTYYELWFTQQAIVLAHENIRLMRKFARTAETKYAVGEIPQQDALKARVELAKLENELIKLRQQELASKAMLMAILNRPANDTIGYAIIPEEFVFKPSLAILQEIAFENRPILRHDSLSVVESRTMLSLAKKEYLPDLKFALEYVTGPLTGFSGWGVSAGLTIPFAPWTLSKASGRVQEAESAVHRSIAAYTATKNMVYSSIAALYHRIESYRKQLETYQMKILPEAQQSLEVSIIAYQTGKTDFLMLLDAYRTLVDLRMEYFMLRMQFEQSVAEMELATGYQALATLEPR